MLWRSASVCFPAAAGCSPVPKGRTSPCADSSHPADPYGVGEQDAWPSVTEPVMVDAGRKSIRSIVSPMLPSPGRFWMLNTALASTVPFDLVIGFVYIGGTCAGRPLIPVIPPKVQLAFVWVCVAVQVTLNVASLIRGPPALTSADSSKFLPVAVDVVVVASVSGSVTVVMHDDVPPPKVTPVLVTTSAVALVGPSIEQWPWVGTMIVEPDLVKFAEPMFATPGWGSAWAGTEAAQSPANNSVPTSAARLALMLRMTLSSLLTGRAARIGSSSTP